MNPRIALSCLSLALLAPTVHTAPTLYLGMNGGTMERVYAKAKIKEKGWAAPTS